MDMVESFGYRANRQDGSSHWRMPDSQGKTAWWTTSFAPR